MLREKVEMSGAEILGGVTPPLFHRILARRGGSLPWVCPDKLLNLWVFFRREAANFFGCFLKNLGFGGWGGARRGRRRRLKKTQFFQLTHFE